MPREERSSLALSTPQGLCVAPAIDRRGKVIDAANFVTEVTGRHELIAWMGSLAHVARASVEGTDTYGARATCHLAAVGIEVIEVNCRDRLSTRPVGERRPHGLPHGRGSRPRPVGGLLISRRLRARTGGGPPRGAGGRTVGYGR